MGEAKNNHILKNANLKPGLNKRVVVERGIINKAQLETRTFSTNADLLTQEKAVQYVNDFFDTWDPKKASKITNTLKEKYDLIESALCSNETVDIFKEDMEDLGVGSASDTGRLSITDLNKDVKTFHPTSDSDSNVKVDKDNLAFTVSNILWCPGFDNVFVIS